jgi:dTDP-4-dehydrorhamnose reductase
VYRIISYLGFYRNRGNEQTNKYKNSKSPNPKQRKNTMKKIMITGAGSRTYKHLKPLLDQLENVQSFGVSREDCDISDVTKLSKVHDQISPDLIINLAAYTNTYAPDQDPKEHIKCYKTNAIGPKNLAMITDKPIIHISTNYVFSNNKQLFSESPQFYGEYDEQFLGPDTAYGMHKLIGENNLITHSRDYYILRTQWLFEKGEDNFISKLVDNKLKEANLDDLSYGIPTSYKTLSQLIFLFAQRRTGNGSAPRGIYNAVNSGTPTTIYQLAKKLGQNNQNRTFNNNRYISIPLSNKKIQDIMEVNIPVYTSMM